MRQLFNSQNFLFLVFLLVPLSTWGQFSPGELSEPHQHLSGIRKCTNCHVLGEGERAVEEKCLSCHTPLAERINAGEGYHAQVEGVCADCHPEHNGPGFDLIYWEEDRENFDHAETGYMLEGKHAELKCGECHTDEYITDNQVLEWEEEHADQSRTMTFLGLPTTCLECHEDYHQKQLSETCTHCHTQDAWKPAKNFDHDQADYTLIGKHQDVKCEDCHKEMTITPGSEPTVQYADMEYRQCAACHEDVHDDQFGQNCTKCHTPEDWKRIQDDQFNHDLTEYPLRGKHRDVECEDCHTPGKPKKPVAHDHCVDCHTDYHKNQFAERNDGVNCEPCHTVEGWIPPRFTVRDHKETDFPLTGAHVAQPCIFCHEKTEELNTERFRWDPLLCTSCHKDEHAGQFAEHLKNNDCNICHRMNAWNDLKFSHEDTDFPLRGEHRQVDCNECHKPLRAQDPASPIQYTKMEQTCGSCHEDIHQGQLAEGDSRGTRCERCHTPDDWKDLIFDHNSMSRFSLKGKHSDVSCAECHPTEETTTGTNFIRYKPLDTECQNCHTFSEM